MAAKSWVTKTNIVDYYRCPYAFWLVDSGQLDKAETVSPLAAKLAEDGVAFQEKVESAAVPVKLPPGGIDQLAKAAPKDLVVFGDLPVFMNRGLRIRGVPDGIELADGAWYPLEVKSHKRVSALDRIELAFYWVLLAPRRTRFPDPEGIVVLRGKGGEAQQVRVPLSRADFDEVHRLIAAVRAARAEGVPPRVCSCPVCSKRPEVAQPGPLVSSGVSMVFGIGWRYEAALRELGCTRHDQMRALVPEDVVAHFRSHKMYISPAVVRSWKLHARAYAEGLPVLSAEREPLPKLGRYIALDLEWGLDDAIFLAGLGIVDNGEVEHMSFWADSPDEEPVVLASLARALDDHPDLPVVTWNGRGADLPHLAKRAAAVAGAGGLVPALGPRHFDLYMWAQAYLRLPGPSLTLKEVARAFGFRASSGLSGGDDAMMVYYQYRRSADPALRDQLVAYNRDDISSLVSVAARLAEMDNCGAPSPGDPWRVV